MSIGFKFMRTCSNKYINFEVSHGFLNLSWGNLFPFFVA